MSFFDARMKVLIKNVFGSAAARFVNLFITLALVPLTINALSTTDYAYFAMAISLSVLAAYADLGMGLAVVNVVAERGAKQTSGRAQQAVSVVWFSLIAIAALGLLLTSLVAAWLNFGMQSESSHQYNAMLLAAGCVFAGLPTGLVQRILFAEQKNIQANAWSTGARIISLGVVWALVATNHVNLLALVFAVIGVPMLIGWLSVLLVFGNKHIEELRPKWSRYDFRLLRHYLVLGLAFLVMQTVSFSETNVDSLIVGGLLSTNLVPPLDVYSKLFNYIPALISIVAFPLWPAIANAKASGDSQWIIQIRKWGYLAFGTLALIASTVIFWQSENIIYLWTHKSLVLDRSITSGMAIFAVLSAIGTMQSMILGGLGVIKAQAGIFLVYAIVLLIAKIFSVYFFGLTAMFWTLNIVYICRLAYTEKFFKLTAVFNVKPV